MKYKRLTMEELKALEPDFVSFLAHAQITAQDWEKMKKEETHKAEELIDVFSDVVYDKVLRKIKYLEFRDPKSIHIYYCGDQKIQLLGLKVQEHSSLDLTKNDVLTQWQESHASAVSVIRSEKPYEKEREVEVFDLLQSGCLITDDRLFNVLSNLK